MENEQLRLDILSILFSKRNGEKYLRYRDLRDWLGSEDPQLISELIALKHLQLIEIQNGLTRFLEGSDTLGMIAITVEGEAYFKQSLERKKLLLLANA